MKELEKWSDRKVQPIAGLKIHYSNKEMDEILYRINDILYFFKNLYVTPPARKFLLEKITEAGKELKNLSFTREDKKMERREEILQQLRTLYKNVEPSITTTLGDFEEQQKCIAKMNSYLTALYLKDKKDGKMTEDKLLEWLKKIKLFAKVYPVCKNLESVQNEIINYFRVENNYE